ncbi:MAG: HAMP domain-containing sensor histidine kinase [Polyangiales bacterium]
MSLAPSDSLSLSRAARVHALMGVVRARLVIAPALGSVALTFAFFEPTVWRKVLLVVAVSVLFALSVIEFVRYRRRGIGVVMMPRNIVLTVLAQTLVILGSGGLFSPMIPVVLILTMLAGLLTDRRTVKVLIALLLPLFWGLAFVHLRGVPVDSMLPRLFGAGPALERSVATPLAAALYTVILFMVAGVGGKLQQLFDELYQEGLRERDRALALHAEQGRTLTTLTAEIAHELKNPLASVKGLSALLAKDVEGRAAERLAVLRGEVDRMQGILEEFLNFSRPLVPLSLTDVDLPELARDVVRLHEGTARERGVRVTVHGEKQARLAGDLRKLRQVLINLLQNALEASPTGAEVSVWVGEVDGKVGLRVEDRGAGLPEAIGARIFEAGVTTKPQGSGLGLVMARALARQHGGELTLRNREGGGAVAALTLPAKPEAA